MKKFLSVLVCFILIISICSVPSSAIAIEILGGSYVAYAVLAAALAAAGYTIATSDVSPEIFQGILDSPNAELVKALIGGTSMYLSAKGQVYFNWTASEWATFTNWVNSYISSGSLIISGTVDTSELFVNWSNFNYSSPSAYVEPYIPIPSGGIFAYYLGQNTVCTVSMGSPYVQIRLNMENNCYFTGSNSFSISSGYYGCYAFGSPIVISNSLPTVRFGFGLDSRGNLTTDRASIRSVSVGYGEQLTKLFFNGVLYTMSLSNGRIRAVSSNPARDFYITGTALFPDTYSTYLDWFSDVISTGAPVGDWTGIGDDVINPAEPEIEVGIDAYPDNQVGVGADAVPDVIDGTIDIPLDRYIDTPIDLSQDPVPIDFTPWQDKTIDTVPDDVIPDVKINPTTDIPDNPDIPWADTESYPIDYPIDTDTTDLPNEPNPNPDPEGDEANKLKLLPLVLSKFPFCLPWDLYHGVNSFFVTAEAPVFDIPLRSQTAGINETIHIDFNNYQTLASVSRWFFSALWVIILIMITRKIIWK